MCFLSITQHSICLHFCIGLDFKLFKSMVISQIYAGLSPIELNLQLSHILAFIGQGFGKRHGFSL